VDQTNVKPDPKFSEIISKIEIQPAESMIIEAEKRILPLKNITNLQHTKL